MPAIVRRRLVGIPILASPRDPAGSSECWGLQEWPFKWVRSPELQRFRHCEGVAGGRGSTTVVAGPIEVTFDEEHPLVVTNMAGRCSELIQTRRLTSTPEAFFEGSY